MLHDIGDQVYRCEYTAREAVYDSDYLLAFDNDQILLLQDASGDYALPRIAEVISKAQFTVHRLRYLFSVSDRSFFTPVDWDTSFEAGAYASIQELRTIQPPWMAFAGVTGYHLAYWYHRNRYCGVCASEFAHLDNERALRCPQCGNVKYPDISLAVIVGVTCGDSLLLTKYAAGNHRRFALIAGFVEIGESLNAAVHREVYEETGLRVDNIRYFDSQPWGFSRSLLVGFFADLVGSPTVNLDSGELSEATWFRRLDIPVSESTISLTAKMMSAFREELTR